MFLFMQKRNETCKKLFLANMMGAIKNGKFHFKLNWDEIQSIYIYPFYSTYFITTIFTNNPVCVYLNIRKTQYDIQVVKKS